MMSYDSNGLNEWLQATDSRLSVLQPNNMELNEFCELLARAFVGTTHTVSEALVDHVLGPRKDGSEMYGVVKDVETLADRYATVEQVATFMYFTCDFVFVLRDESGEICSASVMSFHQRSNHFRWMWSLWAIVKVCMRGIPDREMARRLRQLATAHEVKRLRLTQNQPHLYVEAFFTNPEKQGRGYGRQMLGAVCAAADKLGVLCYLECSSARNKSFYEKSGFVALESSTTTEIPEGHPFVHEGGVHYMFRRKTPSSIEIDDHAFFSHK
ncbi:MAG: uncharacterized protein KVP18_001289 [Porospora cf. gigantea A]|uniref:uncharacterized protein n=1 Tax=Porospora cf. gigantea A TaxID=2853593 RepID=UPI00355A62E3|nr:MAG: hypothetical protein KVP18_001289 [Porospora cf. gigantea A]